MVETAKGSVIVSMVFFLFAAVSSRIRKGKGWWGQIRGAKSLEREKSCWKESAEVKGGDDNGGELGVGGRGKKNGNNDKEEMHA